MDPSPLSSSPSSQHLASRLEQLAVSSSRPTPTSPARQEEARQDAQARVGKLDRLGDSSTGDWEKGRISKGELPQLGLVVRVMRSGKTSSAASPPLVWRLERSHVHPTGWLSVPGALDARSSLLWALSQLNKKVEGGEGGQLGVSAPRALSSSSCSLIAYRIIYLSVGS